MIREFVQSRCRRARIAGAALLTGLLGLVGTVPHAVAHPISLSSATVDVRKDRVAAEIQVMLEDLVLYHALGSGSDGLYSEADLLAASASHRAFLLDGFSIRDAAGNGLSGQFTSLNRIELDGPVAQGELMSKRLIYRFEFPLPDNGEFLTITQTFGGPNALLPAVMDLMLLQNGILIEAPTQLMPGQPHTVRFDWDHPPTKPPGGLAGLRKQRAQQIEQRLGIASYTGLYSFLYITPREVRHEVLIPVLTFEQWLPIARRDPEFLEIEEQEAARKSIASFFQERNPLSIDGRQVTPDLARLNFFSLDINDFAMNAEPRRISVHQGRIGVILSYPAERPPSRLEMRWELFHQHASFLRSMILADALDPIEHFFRAETPELVWVRPGGTSPQPPPVLPVPAPPGSGSGHPTRADAEVLLSNIYRAFEFRDDSEIYHALAASVSGSLLPSLFLTIKRCLMMTEQGGALAQVRQVRVLKVAAQTETNPPRLPCTWRVVGTVEHWGHIHTRENEFEALLEVRPNQGFWKLAGIEVVNENRIRFETGLRGYDSNRKP